MSTALVVIADFAANARPPAAARDRAATAVLDTIGVAVAGASEPAARVVQATIGGTGGSHVIWGTGARASATDAALANGTAAHALDYDDMCFVSLAHPSAPLVPALLAAGEMAHAPGAAALDAYVVGFEIEARLGRVMNPRHYGRGWHCTSTLGTIGAAAAAGRLLGLDAGATAHAIGIAASAASGLKENFGTMVKPLHAGLAARDGVLAAILAREGMTASAHAIEGPQGFLRAMDSEREDLARETGDLGTRWETLDTGITVKLYPSCAGTHPAIDELIDLRTAERLTPEAIASIVVDVDTVTPNILLYDRPASGLEGKFSMPFCAAAAIVAGRVGIDTFDADRMRDDRIAALMPRITMRVDEALGRGAPPLTRARVHVQLHDGRSFVRDANGARGYPSNPAGAADLEAKFTACAARALTGAATTRVLQLLRQFGDLADVHELTARLAT